MDDAVTAEDAGDEEDGEEDGAIGEDGDADASISSEPVPVDVASEDVVE
jgi:hypothetical protein